MVEPGPPALAKGRPADRLAPPPQDREQAGGAWGRRPLMPCHVVGRWRCGPRQVSAQASLPRSPPAALPAQKAFGEGTLGNLGVLTPSPTGGGSWGECQLAPTSHLCTPASSSAPAGGRTRGCCLCPREEGTHRGGWWVVGVGGVGGGGLAAEPLTRYPGPAPLPPPPPCSQLQPGQPPRLDATPSPGLPLTFSAWVGSRTFSRAHLRPPMTSSFSKKPSPSTSDSLPHLIRFLILPRWSPEGPRGTPEGLRALVPVPAVMAKNPSHPLQQVPIPPTTPVLP